MNCRTILFSTKKCIVIRRVAIVVKQYLESYFLGMEHFISDSVCEYNAR